MIYGFIGLQRSGKSHTCELLVDNFDVERIPMAKSVRDVCKVVYGVTDEQLNTQAGKRTIDPRWGMTPRKMLQVIGSGIRDLVGVEVWIKSAEARCEKSSASDIVIDDVRYPNEVRWIREQGGKIIYVFRENHQHPSEGDAHASEVMATKLALSSPFGRAEIVDQELVNDGTAAYDDKIIAKFGKVLKSR